MRKTVPRGAHAAWQAPAGRRSPVDVLEAQAASRLPDLVPLRYGRMLASSFAFFRGAAAVMAMDLAMLPRTGLTVQLCGDAHLANFGVFGSPERELVFDLTGVGIQVAAGQIAGMLGIPAGGEGDCESVPHDGPQAGQPPAALERERDERVGQHREHATGGKRRHTIASAPAHAERVADPCGQAARENDGAPHERQPGTAPATGGQVRRRRQRLRHVRHDHRGEECGADPRARGEGDAEDQGLRNAVHDRAKHDPQRGGTFATRSQLAVHRVVPADEYRRSDEQPQR